MRLSVVGFKNRIFGFRFKTRILLQQVKEIDDVDAQVLVSAVGFKNRIFGFRELGFKTRILLQVKEIDDVEGQAQEVALKTGRALPSQ